MRYLLPFLEELFDDAVFLSSLKVVFVWFHICYRLTCRLTARGEGDEGEQDGDNCFLVHFILSDNLSSVLDKDAVPWRFYPSALEVVGLGGRRV